MSEDKTNPKYRYNPRLHLVDLRKFKERLEYLILGEEDKEWRSELDFVRQRTNQKIREVELKQRKLL